MTEHPAETITGIVGSLLAVFVAFGVNLSDDQIASVLAMVAWIPVIITSIVGFRRTH